jgi:hypothetical protein
MAPVVDKLIEYVVTIAKYRRDANATKALVAFASYVCDLPADDERLFTLNLRGCHDLTGTELAAFVPGPAVSDALWRYRGTSDPSSLLSLLTHLATEDYVRAIKHSGQRPSFLMNL